MHVHTDHALSWALRTSLPLFAVVGIAVLAPSPSAARGDEGAGQHTTDAAVKRGIHCEVNRRRNWLPKSSPKASKSERFWEHRFSRAMSMQIKAQKTICSAWYFIR